MASFLYVLKTTTADLPMGWLWPSAHGHAWHRMLVLKTKMSTMLLPWADAQWAQGTAHRRSSFCTSISPLVWLQYCHQAMQLRDWAPLPSTDLTISVFSEAGSSCSYRKHDSAGFLVEGWHSRKSSNPPALQLWLQEEQLWAWVWGGGQSSRAGYMSWSMCSWHQHPQNLPCLPSFPGVALLRWCPLPCKTRWLSPGAEDGSQELSIPEAGHCQSENKGGFCVTNN